MWMRYNNYMIILWIIYDQISAFSPEATQPGPANCHKHRKERGWLKLYLHKNLSCLFIFPFTILFYQSLLWLHIPLLWARSCAHCPWRFFFFSTTSPNIWTGDSFHTVAAGRLLPAVNHIDFSPTILLFLTIISSFHPYKNSNCPFREFST